MQFHCKQLYNHSLSHSDLHYFLNNKSAVYKMSTNHSPATPGGLAHSTSASCSFAGLWFVPRWGGLVDKDSIIVTAWVANRNTGSMCHECRTQCGKDGDLWPALQAPQGSKRSQGSLPPGLSGTRQNPHTSTSRVTAVRHTDGKCQVDGLL